MRNKEINIETQEKESEELLLKIKECNKEYEKETYTICSYSILFSFLTTVFLINFYHDNTIGCKLFYIMIFFILYIIYALPFGYISLNMHRSKLKNIQSKTNTAIETTIIKKGGNNK